MYENKFNKPNIICSFSCYNLKVVRRGLLLCIYRLTGISGLTIDTKQKKKSPELYRMTFI